MTGRTGIDFDRIGACPTCHAALERRSRELVCRRCAAVWPIVRRVPRFVSSEQYVGSFGWQWRRHRRTQIDSRVRQESERTFAEKTGLTPDDVRGKLVLDVGVGSGRFADVVARWGGYPVGIDLSLAVESARRNLDRYYPGAFVAQADLFHLPFREEVFDVVYSIGVLHHTPSTRDALYAIAPLVKRGGLLVAAVYEDVEEPGSFFDDYFRYSRRLRRYTSAMSHPLLHLLSHAAIPRQHVTDALPATLQSYARLALPMREHADPLWRVLDTFDWYSPRYQWLHTEREVRRWFEKLGLEDVQRLPERTMVSVRGRRPDGPLRLEAAKLSREQRRGELQPLPTWIPSPGVPRDLALLVMVAGAACRSAGEVSSVVARGLLASVTRRLKG